MKLSMWMIANRLSFMDLEVSIRDRTPQVLKSARLAYATDCVTVMQNENDVICIYEDDQIRLKNISLYEAFELVQGVFDFYQDWLDSVDSKLRKYDYQGMLDSCWTVFHNPMVLLNGQKKAIALSSQYKNTVIDDEWEYLLTHQCASAVSALGFVKKQHRQEKGLPQYFLPEGLAKYSSLSCPIFFNHDFCGRINLIEKDRPLNCGDRQLLFILAQRLRLPLAEQYRQNETSNLDWFSILLKSPDVPDISGMFSYLGWSKCERFLLHTITLKGNINEELYRVAVDTLRNVLVGSVVLAKQNLIIVLSNLTLISEKELAQNIDGIFEKFPSHIGISLPYRDIRETCFVKQQVDYLQNRSLSRTDPAATSKVHFKNFAIDYMLESTLSESIHAVHPGIKELWERKLEKGDNKYDLFFIYLKNDRSFVKAAEELYMHRNTLVYHIKKIYEILQIDPDDVEMLDYMKISMYVLNLWERNQSQYK